MSLFDKAWYINFGNGSSTGYYAVTPWSSSTTIAAGTFCRQNATPTVGNERCFVCIGAGSSASSEPAWTVTRGALNTDNTVTWQECTGIPGCNGDNSATSQNVWTASTAFTLGSVIYVSSNSSLQILSAASGNTSSTIPAFSAIAGTVTQDGTSSNRWTSLGAASSFSAFQNPHARLANAFASTWGQAGNSFAVASNHAETQASAFTLTPPGAVSLRCAVYCINSSTTLSSPTVATTATISTTGANSLTLNGTIFYYGITFQAGSGSNTANIMMSDGSGQLNFESCAFILNNTSVASVIENSNQGNNIITADYTKNCTYIFNNASQNITVGAGNLLIVNGTIAASGSIPTTLFAQGSLNSNGNLIIRDTDLSNITGTLFSAANTNIWSQNCKLASGVTINGATFGVGEGSIKLANCDSAGTNYRYYFQNFGGTIKQETTIVLTGGASNGATGISWNITTLTDTSFLQPFVSEEIEIWNSSIGSSITSTFYLTSNTALSNNQFWPEIEYLGNSSYPIGSTVNGRMTLLGSPSSLSSDVSSTWGGSETYQYKCTLTFTPELAGVVKARFYAALSSATIYVDPKIYIGISSGRQYFVPGWGMVNEGASSGAGGGLLTHMDMSGGCSG
jgi:hypothetical protein